MQGSRRRRGARGPRRIRGDGSRRRRGARRGYSEGSNVELAGPFYDFHAGEAADEYAQQWEVLTEPGGSHEYCRAVNCTFADRVDATTWKSEYLCGADFP